MTCDESHYYEHLDPASDHQLITYNLQLMTHITQQPFALFQDTWYNL